MGRSHQGWLVKCGRLATLTNTRLSEANGIEIQAYVARPNTPGPHPPTVIAGGSLDRVPAVLGDFGGTHDEKLKQLFLAGATVARRGGDFAEGVLDC